MLPSLFISHGAPSLVIDDIPARHFIAGLGAQHERPKAILVASAHWNTRNPAVSAVAQPETIHDFGGFPAELYDMRYAAPGAPELAKRVAELVPEVQLHATRGLDHGAWVPLKLMYPAADIPVTQLSLQTHLGPRHHYELGLKLKSLRDEGVLIIGSGSLTHNLYEIGRADANARKAALEFADWVHEKLLANDVDALLDYRRLAPFAEYNHPTEEHFLPLFVALGTGDGHATALHRSVEMGILSMDAYRL